MSSQQQLPPETGFDRRTLLRGAVAVGFGALDGLVRAAEAAPRNGNGARHGGYGEWCGATFSHDGQVLFVNLQGSTSGDPTNPGLPGRTIAIWGPWQRGAL